MQLCAGRCGGRLGEALSSNRPASSRHSSSITGLQQQQQQHLMPPSHPRRQQQPPQQQPQPSQQQAQPVLLFDVMDTIVTDPFFEAMPRFFNMSFKELLAAKHPTAWVEFETDAINQQQLFERFFADGRPFDGDALVQHMVAHYRYIDGMPELLGRLRSAGYTLHAMSNYPDWWRLIEDKLQLSQYLEWTFLSCTGPMRGLRKPATAAYETAAAHLQLPPQQLVFIDDRQPNVEAARAAGLRAITFSGCADTLEAELRGLGLSF